MGGAALEIQGGSPVIENASFVNNAGSINIIDDSGMPPPAFTNVTISGDTQFAISDAGASTFRYCNLFNNVSPQVINGAADPTGSNGNISVDPGFVNTSDPIPSIGIFISLRVCPPRRSSTLGIRRSSTPTQPEATSAPTAVPALRGDGRTRRMPWSSNSQSRSGEDRAPGQRGEGHGEG